MLPFTSNFSSSIVRKDAQLALLQNELDEHDRAPLIYMQGSLSNGDGDGNNNSKKAIGSYLAIQQLCMCIMLFCTFLNHRCTTIM